MNSTTTNLHNLFTDHVELIERDIEAKLGLKARVFETEVFCALGLHTQDEVVKLINDVITFCVKKMRFRRYRGFKLEYITLDDFGKFRLTLNP
jgi:hypothetical protein